MVGPYPAGRGALGGEEGVPNGLLSTLGGIVELRKMSGLTSELTVVKADGEFRAIYTGIDGVGYPAKTAYNGTEHVDT